ncbi:hypothetical protein RND81_07G054800 [Saponaria officinalis]|uniref:Ubiquitin-like protease family profile domain-containing protein n=1 Tax=Saponaria officinalis TaxID=3572 RepID=A0AAW1JNI2_SAPOF
MMEDHPESDSGDAYADEDIIVSENMKTSPPKQKRWRGPTKLKKLESKGPFPLEWDKGGCPTGQYATSFASYYGRRVRSQVNINFDDWDKDVDVGLKNLLCQDIVQKYLANKRHKPFVLSSCWSKWKDFKGKLTHKYIRKKHPKYDSPTDCYSYIEPVDWEKFKKPQETEEFKEKSKKASDSRKQNEHPHLMGRRGYNQRAAEWIAEASTSSSTSGSISSLVLDRSWRWIKGMTKSDGKIPNEKTQNVSDKMTEWQKKVELGEFVPNRVSIDRVLEGTAPLHVPTQYLERVADADGNLIQWPKELIMIGEESLSISPSSANKEKQVSKVLPSKVFFFETNKTIFLMEEDIGQPLCMAFLNVLCIQLFMMYLQKHCEEPNEGLSSIAFLCPTIVSQIGDDTARNDQVMKYVENSLLKMKDVGVVLVPFCQAMHWTLIILCPLTQEAYFL